VTGAGTGVTGAAEPRAASDPRPGALRVDGRALLLIALLALAASAPSLLNGFAYDDYFIIVRNNRVHELARWADWIRTSYWPTREASLYRPLTTTLFALQWVVGHGSPLIFHCLNVVLYMAGSVAFAWLASLLLPPAAALISAALFAVHPAHVEAVGNVVGQSELSAGLAVLVATAIYIRARRAGRLSVRTTIGIGALFLAGALLKEHAIILPAILVVAECTVLRSAGAWRARTRQLAPLYALLAAVAALVLGVRYAVLHTLGGDVPHPSVLGLGAAGRAFVMLGVLPDLARLLVWPAKLYADYSPAQIRVSPTPDPTQINGMLVALGTLVLLAIAWRRSAVATFGLLVAGGAWLPTSNLFFASGILLSERTLYLPTAGVLLAIGVCVAWIDGRLPARAPARLALGGALGVVLILGCAKSDDRQRSWRSRDEVFWVMRRDEPLSFRAHYAWGGLLFERGQLRDGEREWRMALRIFPNYHMIYTEFGNVYRDHGLCNAAIPMYERSLELKGQLFPNRAGLVACQLGLAQFRAARVTARLGIADNEDPAWFRARLASADSALAANDSTR
jgi:tetratricopeptide (TPR) repeat protein